MKNLIEEAYKKLDFLPIFSGNILALVLVTVLFGLDKLDRGSFYLIVSSWILGMFFGTKFVISILNAQSK